MDTFFTDITGTNMRIAREATKIPMELTQARRSFVLLFVSDSPTGHTERLVLESSC
jgi:hypothetical protein